MTRGKTGRAEQFEDTALGGGDEVANSDTVPDEKVLNVTMFTRNETRSVDHLRIQNDLFGYLLMTWS